MTTRTNQVFSVIKNGATNYQLLQVALPELALPKLHTVISYLKQSGFISKTGLGENSVFAVIKEYIPYESRADVPKASKTVEVEQKEPPVEPIDTENKEIMVMPDFNKMFLDMVEVLGDQIALKAKERAQELLTSPETVNQLAHEIMSRFSMPVVLFSGPETSTLTFNTPPAASIDIHKHIGAVVTEPVTSVSQEPIAKVDPSLMQTPKDPDVKEERIRLPRVCVTGMKPIEAGAISKEFAETFDLIFWNDRNGDGVEQLKAHAKNCEALFWHVKHGSHSSESIARDGTAKFHRVNGDLTQMRKKLREYFYELKNTTQTTKAA